MLGRIAMLAFLGVLAGESGHPLFETISGPAIYQYQQADLIIPAFSGNVIGLTFAIEGFNIIGPWAEEAGWGSIPAVGVAGLKVRYIMTIKLKYILESTELQYYLYVHK